MPVRGIRGATTARANTREEIVAATQELLDAMIQSNRVRVEEIASAIFTMTADLDAAFPATTARARGWNGVPLLDLAAPRVPNDLPRCIRVLIHWNTERAANEIEHVYLRDARSLRPDLAQQLDKRLESKPERSVESERSASKDRVDALSVKGGDA